MKFILLTHFKELDKRSNTGRLVVEVLGSAAEQIRWERNQPPAGLVAEIEAGGVAISLIAKRLPPSGERRVAISPVPLVAISVCRCSH